MHGAKCKSVLGQKRFETAMRTTSCCAVFLVIVSAALHADDAPLPSITISPQTTVILGPVRPDGVLDYVAALDEASSHGATPDNNAAVLYWQAFGPAPIPHQDRDRYFRAMGCPIPPNVGEYFVTIEELSSAEPETGDKQAKAAAELFDQFGSGEARLWTEQEFPALAAWLTKNEKPLQLVIEASRRPRRYDPLFSEDGTINGIQRAGTALVLRAARALTARAALRIAKSDFDGALGDSIACHRLARLVNQGPFIVDVLVGDVTESAACSVEQLLLANMPLDANQIRRVQTELAQLSPLPRSVSKIDVAERFEYLDSVLLVARMMQAAPQQKPSLFGIQLNVSSDPDWNEILRTGNRWYDRIVAGMREPTYAQRHQALRRVEDDFDEFGKDLKQRTKAITLLNARSLRTQATFSVIYALLVPNALASSDCDDRAAVLLDLTRVAAGLIAYRASEGSYPSQLSQLSPKYLASVPDDIFSGAAFHYRREGSEMLLYSVGRNALDDRGKTWREWLTAENNPCGLRECDDLVVRLQMDTPKIAK